MPNGCMFNSFVLQHLIDGCTSHKIKQVIVGIIIAHQKDLFNQMTNGQLSSWVGAVLLNNILPRFRVYYMKRGVLSNWNACFLELI